MRRRQAFSAGAAPSIFRAPRERERAANLPKIHSLRNYDKAFGARLDLSKRYSERTVTPVSLVRLRRPENGRAEIPHDSSNTSRKFGSPPRASIVRRQLRSRCGAARSRLTRNRPGQACFLKFRRSIGVNLIANNQVPKSTAAQD
jgi:hypothetical protein